MERPAPRTTSPIGMRPASEQIRSARAFTLIELIIVMALMVTILGLSAPSLSRSLKGRAVKQEATRLLATIEYAREESISQGVPMAVWIDAQNGRFGTQPQNGYEGNPLRQKELSLDPTIHFVLDGAEPTQNGRIIATEFDPDGTLDPSSISNLQLSDQKDESVTLSLSEDGWGYEIGKEGK